MAAKPFCGSGMIATKQDTAPGATKIFFLLLGAEFCRKKRALVQVRGWQLPPGDAGGFCASLLDTLTHLPPFPAASQHRMDF